MEYSLYLYSNIEFKELVNIVKKFIEEYLDEEIKPIIEDEDGFYFSCKFGTGFIFFESDFDYVVEDLLKNVNKSIQFQIFGRSANEGMKMLMSVVGKFIKVTDGDLILLEDSTVVVDRTIDGIIVKQSDYMEYPFEKMGVEFSLI